MYDLLIKGGRVIDPAQNIDAELDVAINGDKVVQLARDIPAAESRKVVTARDRIVCPGLIDIHCHVYDSILDIGAPPDAAGVKQGVTTVVDAGSAGYATFGGFPRYVIPEARTGIFCFLHIGSFGISVMPELKERGEINLEAAAATIESNRDIIKGVKLRLVGNLVTGHGVEVVKIARGLARKSGLPLMIHIGDAQKQVPATLTGEILPLMEKGDILSHVFTALPGGAIGADGTVLLELREAMERGVILDIAHGRSNFSFKVARTGIALGILPTTISTDVTRPSLSGPVYGLTVTMSKLMALGLNLKQVIGMTTINPAGAIGADGQIGSLKPGMAADVSILELKSGKWRLTDAEKDNIEVKRLLSPVITVKSGQLIQAEPPAQPPPVD